MSLKVYVKRNSYQDSVKLMQITEEIKKLEGISRAAAIMGTDNNKLTLARGGFDLNLMNDTGPNDLLLLVDGVNDSLIEKAFETYLKIIDENTQVSSNESFKYRSISAAVEAIETSNIALISVAGEYAAYEAHKALRSGLHVQIFSDNVPVEQEITLKKLGKKLGLLVMGPDCGTSIIGGVPIGFANQVRKGSIGIVGASGTGIQELSVLIDRLGSGISNAIGLGGRDLSDAVGGLSAEMALDLFDKDPHTKLIVLVTKPPGNNTVQKIIKKVRTLSKPVIYAFLGNDQEVLSQEKFVAKTLEEAAILAVNLDKNKKVTDVLNWEESLNSSSLYKQVTLEKQQVYLRGLYTGGSLTDEALIVLNKYTSPVYSNIHPDQALKVDGFDVLDEHSVIDMGSDEFTQGRPHPMIDPSYRSERLIKEWGNPKVALFLVDIVLGSGSHDNPAQVLVDAIKKAKDKSEQEKLIVASVCGTDLDAQNRTKQINILKEAGVIVAPTNASAARIAGELIQCINKGGC